MQRKDVTGMFGRKTSGTMKRALAGLLTAGLVFTGMPLPVVLASNEVMEEQQPETGEISLPEKEDRTENPGTDGETGSPEEKKENPDGTGQNPGQTEPTPGAGADTSKPGTGAPGEEESGEENAGGVDAELPKTEEEESTDNPEKLETEQISGNDMAAAGQVSGNDLMKTESDKVLMPVEGGGSYQEGAFSVPDTSAGSRPRRAAALGAREEQSAADYLYEQMRKKIVEIDVSEYKISKDDITNLLIGVVNDHPDLYFARTGYDGGTLMADGVTLKTIKPLYVTDATLDDGKFQQGVQDALVSVQPGMTELEKAVALHDYLVLNCEYDYDRLNSDTAPQVSWTAYGVLAEKIAVCQGYALAYKYLLNQVGIECYMVTSDAMKHAWNLIRLDGDYYQVDVTWDDPVSDRFGLVGHNHMFVSDTAFQAARPGMTDNHYGWVITTGSSKIGLTATNSQYDDTFWVDVISPIVFDGHRCYYISNDKGIVSRSALMADTVDALAEIGKWGVLDKPGYSYTQKYSGLFRLGDRLYYNSPDEICSVSLTDKTIRKETAPLSTSDGAVFGCAYLKGEVKYVWQDKPGGDSSNKSILTATLTTPVYQVTFNMQGHGTAPGVYTGIHAGDIIPRPTDPTAEGYRFAGWYKDAAYTEPWDFDNDTVQESLTLYAKWEREIVSLADAVVTLLETDFTYDKTAKEPKIKVTVSGVTLTEGTDYTLSYENNINAGTATVKVTGEDSYSGEAVKTFVIKKAPLTIKAKDITIQVGDPLPEETQYGYETFGLVSGDTVTTSPTYTCTVADRNQAGTYDIEPSGARVGTGDEDNYEITYQKGTLTIEKVPVVTYKVTFNMQGHGTAPAGYDSIASGNKLEKPADPTAEGYAFKGWYKDAACTEEWNFASDTVMGDLILYAKWEKKTVSLADAEVTLLETDFTYDKTAKEPKAEVTVSGVTLKEGTDYTLSYENNINAGTATVKVTGEGGYSGEANRDFEIKKAPLTIRAKDVRILVNGEIPADYEYEAIGLADGDELTKKPSFQCGITDSTETGSYEIVPSGADAGSNYEISYENGTLTVVDEYVYYKVTFDVLGRGTAPAGLERVRDGETISRPADPTAEGYAFKGWYKDAACTEEWDFASDTVTGDLILYAKWEKKTVSLADAEVTLLETDFTYDKTAKEPKAEVTVSGVTLKEGTDYTLSYENNINAGTATVKVTGKGGYSGENSKGFEIKPAQLTIWGKDQSIRIGDPVPDKYEYTVVGLFDGDNLSVEPSFTCDIADTSEEGIYDIVPFGADAGSNYIILYADGRLRVVAEYVSYTVTFDVQGHGTAPAAYTDVKIGSTVKQPADPTAEGYLFDGWYQDKACTKAWNFARDTVQKNMTLYAKWVRETIPIQEEDVSLGQEVFTYDGTRHRPEVTVTVRGVTLVEGQDYRLAYKNNRDAGIASVNVFGINGYSGGVSKIFRIEGLPLVIRAKDKAILLGDPIPGPNGYEYEVRGLLDGDRLTKEPSFTCSIRSTETAGQYDIVPGGAEAGKGYSITYESGILTVADEYVSCTVTFDRQGHGGSSVSYVGVKVGSTIVMPEEPTEEGYRFVGWYRDAACTRTWDFENDIVQTDLTLYAKWLRSAPSESGNGFALQEITDFYYTGRPCKPVVSVYDGETLLKAGRDYQIKYYNNTNANADGRKKTGSGSGEDFNPSLPYVEIIGKGDYRETAKVNFNILRAPIGDGGASPADGVKLKVNDQLVTASRGSLKPFSSISYVQAMRLNVDYTVSLTAVDAKDAAGNSLTGELDGAVIPAGCSGKFLLAVAGVGNYDGSICRPVHVADKVHLMKNASVTLGKNQKNVTFAGKAVELNAGEANSADTFTVKCGGVILKPGQDYTVSYRGNDRVGKAEMTVTGTGMYAGSKTVTFNIKGAAFSARTVSVGGIADQAYTGRAWTQNGAVLTYVPENKLLVYGTDYTISYSRNVNKGTATMTFKGVDQAGYSGSFKKTFKITTADISRVNRAESMQNLVFDYCKAGVKPVEEIILTDQNGYRLKNGRDYTLRYANNKAVADITGPKPPTVIVKGKGNYAGEFSVPFRIVRADLAKMAVTTTPAAYKNNKAADFAYKPAVKLMEGRTALRAGRDYEIVYQNNTQADYDRYMEKWEAAGTGGPSADGGVPAAVISEKAGSAYCLDEPIIVPLPIYRTQFKKALLTVEPEEAVYTGSQVRPSVKVYYGSEREELEEGRDYTVSYGDNIKSGKNRGSVTVSGMAPEYGGSITVKFDIIRKPIIY